VSRAFDVKIQQLCTEVARWCTSVEDTSLLLLDVEGTPCERVLKETARLALPSIALSLSDSHVQIGMINDLDSYLHNPPEQNIKRTLHGLLLN
jgi:hypothetical protein